MKKKIIISSFVLFVSCAGASAFLFYAGVLFFNNPSYEKYPIRGVDVSSYQGAIDWDVIESQNIRFAFIKATEGSSFVDPWFHENYENTVNSGIRVGAYHFFSFDSGGDTQADNFIREVKKLNNMLPPVIDIEFYDDKRSNPPDRESVTEQLNVFITKIEEAYAIKPIIYAVYETYNLYIKDDFADCGIWIRDVFSFPKLPDSRDWTFWQYTDRAKLSGYNGEEKHIDLNSFCGTEEQFENYGKLSPETQALSDGNTLYSDFAGEWHRTNIHSSIQARLYVENVSATGFDFRFEAFYWSHMGFFAGQAEFTRENRAVSTKIIDGELPSYEFAQLEFILEDGIIIIPNYDYNKELPVGALVSVNGEYTKGEPEYINADNYRKVVPNDEVADIIKELLGADLYDYFDWAAHNGDPIPCNVEGYPGYEVRTFTMGGITFRIAVTENNKVLLWQDGFGEESKFYSNR